MQSERRIVARAFVAQEGVLRVELVPGEVHVFLFERFVNFLSAFPRHVRILPAPEHEQLGFDVDRTRKRVVSRFAQRGGVEIGRVKTGRRQHILVFGRGAKTKMTADANPDGAESAGARLVRLQIIEDRPGIAVERVQFLLLFQGVAAFRSGLIVGQRAPGWFELVINLRHRHDITVSGEKSCRPADRRGHLEDLRVKKKARVSSICLGTEEMSSHGTGRSRQVDEFRVSEDHGRRSYDFFATDEHRFARILTGRADAKLLMILIGQLKGVAGAPPSIRPSPHRAHARARNRHRQFDQDEEHEQENGAYRHNQDLSYAARKSAQRMGDESDVNTARKTD